MRTHQGQHFFLGIDLIQLDSISYAFAINAIMLTRNPPLASICHLRNAPGTAVIPRGGHLRRTGSLRSRSPRRHLTRPFRLGAGRGIQPGDRRAVTASSHTARLWDVSRSGGAAGGRAHRRPGAWRRVCTKAEHADLLMQDAPDDLSTEALKQAGRAADDPDIAEIVAQLQVALHPNCI